MDNNKYISWKAIGLVIVVFVLGIALGSAGVHFWDAHVQASQQRRSPVKELKGILHLTSDQEKQFDAILSEEFANFHTLDTQQRAEYDPKYRALRRQEHAEWDPKWDATRAQGREKLRAILTPDQRAKFDAFVKELDARREKERKQETN